MAGQSGTQVSENMYRAQTPQVEAYHYYFYVKLSFTKLLKLSKSQFSLL